MKNNKNKNIRYFGEIIEMPNGRFKVKFMQRLVGINQHRRKWRDVDTLEFAKELNSKLITD